mgnify:CR=1 FL=1
MDKFEKICEAISNKDGVEYLINGKALLNDNSGFIDRGNNYG